MSSFLEVYTEIILLTILVITPTLSKHSPPSIPNLSSHDEHFLEYFTWHVVSLVQENWLETFSLT